MDKIKIIHDMASQTLTIWIDDPAKESICEETTEEVVLIKDAGGKVIGFEVLHYQSADQTAGITVETVLRSETKIEESDGRETGAGRSASARFSRNANKISVSVSQRSSQ